jgi:hypothetical protein
MSYCTLDDVKTYLKGDAAKLTAAQSAFLQATLRVVDDSIGKVAGDMQADLEPRYKAEKFTATSTNVNTAQKLLTLGKPLLEIVTLTSDGSSLTFDTDVYAEPYGLYPIRTLRIDPMTNVHWWPCSGCNPYNTILLTAFWGIRRYYDTEGFLAIDALALALDNSTSAVKVADIDGVDYYGLTPRISVGNLLRIDNELMLVTAVDTATNTATVIRGYHNSPKVAHLIGATVKVWNIEPEIRQVAARQVGLIYNRRGMYETTVQTEFATVTYPADFVTEVRAALQRLMYA